MTLYLRADWTSVSQYYIDFERGQILHSRSASRGQTNRFFRTHDSGGNLKHLTYAQAADFHLKTRVIELYLQYLRQVSISELGRGVFQASPTYLRNHQRVFDRSLKTLQYPVAQSISIGYVRTLYDRQKLVDYMTKLVGQSIKYGQSLYSEGVDNQNQVRQGVIKSLRQIAFAAPKTIKSE